MFRAHTRFQHSFVRDLAWCIGSPALLQGPVYLDDAFFARQLELHHDWLLELDGNPAALEAHVEGHEHEPLGRFFERLIGFWLAHSPHWELLGANLQVIDNGVTLGEFDFVAIEKPTGLAWHFEVAIKYYLGMPVSNDCGTWVGVNGNDSLAMKVRKMETRQLRLSETPAGVQVLSTLGIKKVQSVALVKGRLAYPLNTRIATIGIPTFAGALHCTSHWAPLAEADDWASSDWRYYNLPRYSWLGGHPHPSDCGSWEQVKAELVRQWQQSERPRTCWVVACRQEGEKWVEAARCFVLPPTWRKA